ncbi:MAG: TlyA family RNA methyltransferase [Bryobacterales bacterium]|jgi:23S rRNA (cytidine1920-2'-O)/16S rRNA (cytidine1409-2'-O)-methyltransferase|nr:TlyA family RNA methyltransferase [Bryobacterales bacterium]
MAGVRRMRLDVALVERGLAASREKAQAMILAGEVTVNAQKARKAGQPTSPDDQVLVEEKPRYVSRGGLKMEGALRAFALRPEGWVCVDVGASTGGFTDCLLQHGAARVYALDVGHNQLDWRLRTHPQVVSHEGVNVRYLDAALIPEPADLIVCDVSFISVTLLLPAFPPLLKPGGRMVILVKPQFEAGRDQVGPGGIVRDTALHQTICQRVASDVEALGFFTRIAESPITGAEGNREFLLYAERQDSRPDCESERGGQ